MIAIQQCRQPILCVILALFTVTVVATNFGPTVDINDNKASTGDQPQIALNNLNKAVAVWQENMEQGIPQVFSRTFNGFGWSQMPTLISNSGMDAWVPQIALNDSGIAIIVWEEGVGQQIYNVIARIFDGTSWVQETTLNSNPVRDAGAAQISLNDNDTAVAVWREDVGQGISNVFARTFNGASWGQATTLNSNSAMDAGTPQISLNDNDTAVAVWAESTEQVSNVFARTFNGASWGQTTTLNSNPAMDAGGSPQISLNDNDTAVAVWVESTGQVYNVFARTFNGASWGQTTTLNSNPDSYAGAPQISLNDNGTAVAVWVESTGQVYNVFARTFNGASWSQTTTLNSNSAMDAGAPQISLNDNDTAVAVWHEDVGQGISNVFASTFDGGSWSQAVNINNNLAKTVSLATQQIALNDNNFAIPVWAEEGSPFNIFARQTAIPYNYNQWLSATQGTNQYIAASGYNNGSNYIDIYEYNPSMTSIEFKTTITFDQIPLRFAVYNKADNDLRIATTRPLQIWKFNGISATLIADLSSYLSFGAVDAQWWATSNTQSYIAAVSQHGLTILDLVDLNKTASLGVSGGRLLWTTKNNYTGLIVLDEITTESSYISMATPYKVDFSTNPITIVPGTGVTAAEGLGFHSISTCGDYIAVGLSSTDTSAYGFAQVRLLTLDTDTNTLEFSGTATILEGQVRAPSLARCCCCAASRPLLVGSYDINGKYNINVFVADLSQRYASTILGNIVDSVAWSCQGENIHLSAVASEDSGFLYAVTYNFSELEGTLEDPIVLYHN